MIKVADFGLSEYNFLRNYFRQDRDKEGVRLLVRQCKMDGKCDGLFTEKTDVIRKEKIQHEIHSTACKVLLI